MEIVEAMPGGKAGVTHPKNGSADDVTLRVCGCIAGGTTVSTSGGEVSLSSIEVGQGILVSAQGQDSIYSRVTSILKSGSSRMLRLWPAGKSLLTTPGHTFFVPRLGRFVAADSILVGALLLTATQQLVAVDSVTAESGYWDTYDIYTEQGAQYSARELSLLTLAGSCNVELQQAPIRIPRNIAGRIDAELRNRIAGGHLPASAMGDFIAMLRGGSGGLRDWFRRDGAGRVRIEDKVRAWETSYSAIDIHNWNSLVNTPGMAILPQYNSIVENMISQGGGPISLGFLNQLTAFATGTRSVKYQEWAAVFDTNPNVGVLSVFESVFHRVTNASVNAGHKIHFKLDGIIGNHSHIAAINNGIPPITEIVTVWELGNIVRNIDLFSNTIFYRNGQVVKLPELLQVGIQPIN